jgi:hypothetical protein
MVYISRRKILVSSKRTAVLMYGQYSVLPFAVHAWLAAG